MKKRLLILVMFCMVSVGCIPVLGGQYVTNADMLESDEGIHSLEQQQGTTVKQLYDAIHKAIKENPKEFELKGDDFSENKSVIWVYSSKYSQQVTFYVYKDGEYVYLGIDIGKESKADEDIKDIYYLEDLVQKNLK
ncbi:MAG: hypothetical protein ACI8TE_000432 [Francisella sp.]|jgi:hypothetical protein